MRFTPNNNICEPAKPITTDWKSIKWNKVNRHVTSLQRRIYRASRNNDRKKVRDLQRQLMRSNSALLIAIKRVTQVNKGKYTPGIDGFKATTDKARGQLVDMLKEAGAKEVHMRISAPPFIWPCYFGTDIPSKEHLLACNYSVDEIYNATLRDKKNSNGRITLVLPTGKGKVAMHCVH